jgi:PAS domain S-box-containing protein
MEIEGKKLLRPVSDSIIHGGDSLRQKAEEFIEPQQIELEMQIEELRTISGNAKNIAEKYIQLYDSSPFSYFTIDQFGTISEINRGGATMLNKQRTGLIGCDLKLFITQDTLPIFNNFLLKAFETNSKQTCEVKMAVGENCHFPVYLEGLVVEVEKEKKCLLTAIDITELKKTGDAEAQNFEKYRTLIELATDAFIQGDPEGNFITVNKKAAELTGFSKEELLGMNMSDLFSSDVIRKKPLRYDLLKLGETVKTEREFLRKTGEKVYIEMNSKAMPDGTYQCFFRDVTDCKMAEEALQASEEKYRILIDESSDPIFAFNPDGEYRYVNMAFANGVGRKRDEIVGRKIWDVFSKDEADKRFAAVKWVFENGLEKVLEVRVPRPDEDRFYLTTVKPILNELGEVTTVICISKDITDRKRAEEALAENEAHLRELNATKDKFFSIIAHDLKGPFNSIMGFSNMLERQIQEKDYDGIEKYASIIRHSSQRAMDLLLNLLEWSRSQTGRMEFTPEYIDIVAITKEVSELLFDSAQEKSITIYTELPHIAIAFADKAMISTILRNLISNAIKFTNTGGEIVISVGQKTEDLTVSISDNGVGINEEAIEKLFRIDKSQSTYGTQNEKGTGLGLILCKEFVEKHGGKIWVESQVANGSTFWFSIPKR